MLTARSTAQFQGDNHATLTIKPDFGRAFLLSSKSLDQADGCPNSLVINCAL